MIVCLHLRPALRAELCIRQQLAAALGAELLALELRPAFGAEFGVVRQRRFAVRTGGPHPLAPALLLEHLPVFLRHLRVGPDLLHRAAALSGGHLHAQVGGAFFAQALFVVPAALAAHPVRAARALDEVWFQLFHRRGKSVVVGLFPGGRAHALGQVGGLTEDPAEQAVGGVHHVGHRAGDRGLEAGAITACAAVAVELKLETLVGGEVGIVASELDFIGHDVAPGCEIIADYTRSFTLSASLLTRLRGASKEGWEPLVSMGLKKNKIILKRFSLP